MPCIRDPRRAVLLPAFLVVVVPACGNAVLEGCEIEPPAPQNIGVVDVDQFPPAGTADGSAPSFFFASFHLDRVVSCVEVEREGTCRFEYCDSRWAVEGTPVDAGEVSVTGGLIDVAASMGKNGAYAEDHDSPMFAPGDPLEISIEGGEEIEPVSITLEAPPLPVITQPMTLTEIDRSQPLELQWTAAAGAGRVVVVIVNYPEASVEGNEADRGPVAEWVSCEADIAAGSVVVPASLLQQLTPGAPLQPSLAAHVRNGEARERDGWRFEINVSEPATTPDGGIYGRTVDLK